MATLGEILTRVRSELRDLPRVANAEVAGDGVSIFFQLPDYPVVPDSLIMKVSVNEEVPAEDTDFELDEETGGLTLTGDWVTTPPDDTHKITWEWLYTHLSDADLYQIINSALRYVGQEYMLVLEDTDTTTSLDLVEYAAPVTAKRIVMVELNYENWGEDNWERTHKWVTRKVGNQLYIKFTRHPGNAPMRITYVARPTPFITEEYEIGEEPEGWTDVASQELSDTGLPDEALEPIIYYTLWMALERRILYRSRDDAAQHEKEETTVTMRDLEARSARMKMLFELHYSQFQTEYINGRLTD